MKEKFPGYSFPDPYVNSITKMKVICPKKHEYYLTPNNLMHTHKGYTECNNTYVRKGENDFYTKYPHLRKYLKDKNLAKNRSFQSHKKVEVVCPDCEYEYKMNYYDLGRNGFNCPVCGTNNSYSNRFIRAFFAELKFKNVNFEWEPKWGNRRRYDAHFFKNGKEYVVKLDGSFHFVPQWETSAIFSNSRDNQKIDKLKDDMAKEHGIEMIRIDCYYSRLEYIKKNILKSKLAELFDLSDFDWGKCDEKTRKNIEKLILNFNSTFSTLKIKE